MKTFAGIAALFTLATAAVASPLTRRDDPKIFKLKAAADAPAPLTTLGAIDWDGEVGGNLGWFKGEADFTSFIQYNAKSGIAFYAKDTANEIYLRPTHGTPVYFAKVGNPELDAVPALTLSGNWTITGDAAPYYLGYAGSYYHVWTACGSNSSFTLYNGPGSAPESQGCTKPFNIEVEYL